MTARNPQQVGAVLWFDMTDDSTITVDASNLVQSVNNKLGTPSTHNFNASATDGMRPYAKRAQDKYGPNNAGVMTQYRNTGSDNKGSGIVQQSRYTGSTINTIFCVLYGDYGTTYTTYYRGLLGRAGSPSTLISMETNSILRLTVNGVNTDTNIAPISRIHNVPMCFFLKLDPAAPANLKLSTDFATYLFDISTAANAAGGCPSMGLPTSFTSGTMVGWYGCVAVFGKVLTSQEMLDLMEWAKSVWVTAASPYPDVHDVTDISQAADPECIYYGQTPTITTNDQFSFKNTTETNLWPVSIDQQGFPIANSGGVPGFDSFRFNISRANGAWTPTPPAYDVWQFAIAPTLSNQTDTNPTADGATVTVQTNSGLGKLYLAARTAAQGGAYAANEQLAIRDGVVGVDCSYKAQITAPLVAPSVNTFIISGLNPGVTYYYGMAQDIEAV